MPRLHTPLIHSWNSLEILQPAPASGKGIGDTWERTLKDQRTQAWYFAAGGIRKLIGAFVSGALPNRGVIIRALGSRQESFDSVAAVLLTIKYHVPEACARPPKWCTHAGSSYRQVPPAGHKAALYMLLLRLIPPPPCCYSG